MSIEKEIIKLIESLDRIMDTWSKLTLRRTLLNCLAIILFTQVIITTILWIAGREISNVWLGILTVEFGSFSTMIGFYFSERKDNNIKQIGIRKNEKINNSRMEEKKEDDDIEG